MAKEHPDKPNDEASDRGASGGVIRFVSSGENPPEVEEPVVDWRDELKQKIEAHAKRKEGAIVDEPQSEPEPAATAGQPPTSETLEEDPEKTEDVREVEEVDLEIAELIDSEEAEVMTTIDIVEGTTYERAVYPEENDEPVRPRQQIITFSEQVSPGFPQLEESVFDMAPQASSIDSPEEGDEVAAVDFSADPADETSSPPREIFVSRVLAGLVDLLLSAVLGITAAAIAARMLNFLLLSKESGLLVVGMGLFFFVFSSVFLFLTSGQTIGMRLTRLQLVHESASLSASAVLVRVIAFLPVLATAVGLLWGLFDPWGRCLHDRISQTRVVPLEQEKPTRAGLGLLR